MGGRGDHNEDYGEHNNDIFEYNNQKIDIVIITYINTEDKDNTSQLGCVNGNNKSHSQKYCCFVRNYNNHNWPPCHPRHHYTD